nr:uncharacterized protein LOC111418159 isoform X2 [Onthophagus taurus]
MGDAEIKDPFCDPKNPVVVPFCEIASASILIRDGIVKTPCELSRITDLTCMNVYLKKDYMQYTGNFKERGARYAMLKLDEASKKRGLVSASAGNHAQAMCWHGLNLGIPITVVMPITAPIMKVQRCRKFKANVIVDGINMYEAKNIALRYARDNNAIYISGYDNPDVIAGQGTCGLEILDQVPNVDVIIVPTGGGGLLAGVAAAVKTVKPSVKVYGVESVNCMSFAVAMKAGGPTLIEAKPTLADGLAVPCVGYNAYATAKKYIDGMIQVKEEDIAVAILRLVEIEKAIVEGSGAAPVAAVLSGQLAGECKNKNVVLICSGGNIDTTVLSRVLDRGLASDGRLIKTYVTVSDRPGGLAELLQLITSLGIPVKHINQERAWVKLDIFSVEVKLTCETRDYDHAKELEFALKEKYGDNARIDYVQFPASSGASRKF